MRCSRVPAFTARGNKRAVPKAQADKPIMLAVGMAVICFRESWSVGISIYMCLWFWWDIAVIGGHVIRFFQGPQSTFPILNFIVCSLIVSSLLLNINLTAFITRILFCAGSVLALFMWWYFSKVKVALIELKGILAAVAPMPDFNNLPYHSIGCLRFFFFLFLSTGSAHSVGPVIHKV